METMQYTVFYYNYNEKKKLWFELNNTISSISISSRNAKCSDDLYQGNEYSTV